jgi:alanine racemase
MDNITVDLGPHGLSPTAVGGEVVLIGTGLSADEVARRSGTINYEITTALLPRAVRTYYRS